MVRPAQEEVDLHVHEPGQKGHVAQVDDDRLGGHRRRGHLGDPLALDQQAPGSTSSPRRTSSIRADRRWTSSGPRRRPPLRSLVDDGIVSPVRREGRSPARQAIVPCAARPGPPAVGPAGPSAVASEEEDARGDAAARGDHGRAGAWTWRSPASWRSWDGLVEEPETVGPPLGELAAVGIDRQLAVEGDPPSPVQPVVGLTEPAEPEGLEPGDGVEGEAVVEQGQVDVGRAAGRSSTTGGRPGPGPGARG